MKHTGLFDWHINNKASMSPFGDYEMPLWYSAGAKDEHLAVLSGAGLFDTSHMAVVKVKGKDAKALIQKCFSKDLDSCIGKKNEPITPGRCTYGVFLNEKGFVIDDSIIYQIEKDFYLVIVNSGMGGKISEHLASHSSSFDVSIKDMTDLVGKIDLQGPKSAKIIKKLISSPDSVLNNLPYFSFKGFFEKEVSSSKEVMIDNIPILLSRTGYTGEFGFEIFTAPEYTVKIWDMILKAGEEFGILPCGLAARDSLRAGAVLPLSHQDIGAWIFLNNPWPFALSYDSEGKNFTKDFIGKDALLKAENVPYTLPFVGYDLRKISTHETETSVSDDSGKTIGKVLTCVSDMGISREGNTIYSISSPDKPEGFKPKGLCCGFILVEEKIETGKDIFISDDKRKLKVTVINDVRPARTARTPLKEML